MKRVDMDAGFYKAGDPLPLGNNKCNVCGLDVEHAHQHNAALFITCFCGLARILPNDLVFGERFVLPPCPGCGAAFHGRYYGQTVDFEL